MLRQLIETGGDLSIRTREVGWSVHHMAVLAESPAVLREVVKMRVDLDMQDEKRTTTLMICAGESPESIPNAQQKARILLEGAHCHVVNDEGASALVIVAWRGSHGIIETFLQAGEKFSRSDDRSSTALIALLRMGT